jgi:outer membrane protein
VASFRISLVPAAVALMLFAAPASSETLPEALASAYANNAELNAARASTRATDEAVPQALSGYRPRIDAFLDGGLIHSNPLGLDSGETRQISTGIALVQPIFRGFRTQNGVKAAEAAVRASREQLRNIEQNVLGDAVIAYMDVVLARQVLALRKSNVEFLSEQARASRDRLEVGEGTRTDVAQADAAYALATSDVSGAEANLTAAAAVYNQVIGHEPGKLAPGKSVEPILPKSIDEAIAISRGNHPAIIAAEHNADVAGFNVKVIEGELLPTLQIEAGVSRAWEYGYNAQGGTGASVFGRLSIPIYEGGQVYSRVREAKELLGQARIGVDVARDQVHAALVSAWGGLDASLANVTAARAQVDANKLALEGVIEEQRVGQRTTLDVLNAQADVINSQIQQVQTERNVVVASYAVLSAVGRLSRETLGLQVADYQPEHHYKQVRDKWIGLRTPDGR